MRRLLATTFFACSCALASAQPLPRLTVNSQLFVLEHKGAAPTGAPQHDVSVTRLRADNALSRATQQATTLFVLGGRSFDIDGQRYMVLATSRPSTNTNGHGYCGAGTEDELLLVRWVPQQHLLKLQDSMLVQSCLQSITLASDQGTQLEAALGQPSQLDPLELTWLTHPKNEGRSRRYKVVAGKWQAL